MQKSLISSFLLSDNDDQIFCLVGESDGRSSIKWRSLLSLLISSPKNKDNALIRHVERERERERDNIVQRNYRRGGGGVDGE